MGRHLPVLACALARRGAAGQKQPASAVSGRDAGCAGRPAWTKGFLSAGSMDDLSLPAGDAALVCGRDRLRVAGISEGLDPAAAGAAGQLL